MCVFAANKFIYDGIIHENNHRDIGWFANVFVCPFVRLHILYSDARAFCCYCSIEYAIRSHA